MAARRLLIIMLVLLGISSVIAIAVPDPNRDDQDSQQEAVTGTTGATGTTGETGANGATGETGAGNQVADGVAGDSLGEVSRETIDLDATKPARIEAKAGSRMILIVKSKSGSEVEIEGLGLNGFADPFAPAVFDVILPDEAGQYRIQAPGKKPAAVLKTSV